MRTKSLTRGFSTAAAGLPLMIASLLAAFTMAYVSPALRARQLDSSAQEIAGFLQKARSESALRGTPVACRLEIDGRHTVLSLDWNVNGGKTSADGEQLVLDQGLVLMQAGILQKAGTIAVFHPRGGVMFGAVHLGSGEPAVLSVWQRGGPTTDVRDIALTGSGDFGVMGTAQVGQTQLVRLLQVLHRDS